MRTERAAQEYTETWCKDGKLGYVVLSGGARVRYLRVGVGPPLVLLHTVRTQLDHFQLVIPQITDAFTVYAVDFPGMGWSDIVPGASYDEAALRAAVVRVVEDLDLADLTLAGESMGATLALTASVDLGDRVRRIVAFNTYDFADGVQRANLLARLVVGNVRLPGWGPMFARLESKPLLKGILRGGLHDPRQLPDHYLDELRRVGRRPGYPRVARAIYRNLDSLIAARERYARISQRPGRVGLRRPRLVAALGSASQHRVGSRRPSHPAARHRSFRCTGSPPRRGADLARRRPMRGQTRQSEPGSTERTCGRTR
jgi:pimeloyl-ACP methyl ester carboxylesterase